MPERCASIRSMAKWVLPVLVGPRTAEMRLKLSGLTAPPDTRAAFMMPRMWGLGRSPASTYVRGDQMAREETGGSRAQFENRAALAIATENRGRAIEIA